MPTSISFWSSRLLKAAYRSAPGPIRFLVKRHLPTKISRQIALVTQAAPPAHFDPHSLLPHSADTYRQIAAMVGGPSARAVRSEEIKRGTENYGIIIYRIDGSRQPSTEIVEKITTWSPEAMLSHCIHQAGKQFRGLVPRIYGVTRSERHYHIFMERLQRPHPPPDAHYGPELADLLAQDALRFSQAVQELMNDKKYAFPLSDATKSRGRAALRELVASSGEVSLKNALTTVEDELSLSKPVMSHNDLHWGNISLEWDENGPRPRFIDLNLVGRNFPGAEFYFFARQGRRESDKNPFFQRLSTTYASLSGVPVHLLRAAAYFQAAQRTCWGIHTAPARSKMAQRRNEAISLLLEAQRELLTPERGRCGVQDV